MVRNKYNSFFIYSYRLISTTYPRAREPFHFVLYVILYSVYMCRVNGLPLIGNIYYDSFRGIPTINRSISLYVYLYKMYKINDLSMMKVIFGNFHLETFTVSSDKRYSFNVTQNRKKTIERLL